MQTRVGVAHNSAYRSALNFKNPDSFEPERWLPNTGYDDDQKEAMQPFSVGPRNCLGKKYAHSHKTIPFVRIEANTKPPRSLAYHEMRAILATVLWHFDFELCPESEDWSNQKVYTVWEKKDLFVKLKPIRN